MRFKFLAKTAAFATVVLVAPLTASAEEMRGEQLRTYLVGASFECESVKSGAKFTLAYTNGEYSGKSGSNSFGGKWKIDDDGTYRRVKDGAKRTFVVDGNAVTISRPDGNTSRCTKL